MENREMIYTAIYQCSTGELSYETYSGHMSRKDAWLEAATQGGANDKCLLALVPGVHPVYFYSDFVQSVADTEQTDSVKQIDLFDLNS